MMIGRLLFAGAALGIVMTLSGCVVGDGIAYVVKAAEGAQQRKTAPAAVAQPQPAPMPAAAPVDDGPQPVAPAPAPRDSISVEQLPAPH